VSYAVHQGLIEPVAKSQTECFAAGLLFARTEGIMPAPEATHGLASCIDEARRCRETGSEEALLVLVTGHAHFDLAAYASFQAGQITDEELSVEQLEVFLSQLPVVSPH
jgi:tryptophan synthase beta chain